MPTVPSVWRQRQDTVEPSQAVMAAGLASRRAVIMPRLPQSAGWWEAGPLHYPDTAPPSPLPFSGAHVCPHRPSCAGWASAPGMEELRRDTLGRVFPPCPGQPPMCTQPCAKESEATAGSQHANLSQLVS